MEDFEQIQRYRKLLIKALSAKNKKDFIISCIYEKVRKHTEEIIVFTFFLTTAFFPKSP